MRECSETSEFEVCRCLQSLGKAHGRFALKSPDEPNGDEPFILERAVFYWEGKGPFEIKVGDAIKDSEGEWNVESTVWNQTFCAGRADLFRVKMFECSELVKIWTLRHNQGCKACDRMQLLISGVPVAKRDETIRPQPVNEVRKVSQVRKFYVSDRVLKIAMDPEAMIESDGFLWSIEDFGNVSSTRSMPYILARKTKKRTPERCHCAST